MQVSHSPVAKCVRSFFFFYLVNKKRVALKTSRDFLGGGGWGGWLPVTAPKTPTGILQESSEEVELIKVKKLLTDFCYV